MILPEWTFFTKGLTGEAVPGGSSSREPFLVDHGGTWGRGSVTPYPEG